MQLGLFVVVVFLSSMDLTGSSKVVKGKRQRRSMYEMLFFSTSSRDAVQFVQTVNVNVKVGECLTDAESWAEPGVPHEPPQLPESRSHAETCTPLSCRTCCSPGLQAIAPAPWQLPPLTAQAARGRDGEELPCSLRLRAGTDRRFSPGLQPLGKLVPVAALTARGVGSAEQDGVDLPASRSASTAPAPAHLCPCRHGSGRQRRAHPILCPTEAGSLGVPRHGQASCQEKRAVEGREGSV